MLNELDELLAIANADLRQKNKLNAMHRSAQQSLVTAKKELARLEQTLAKEQSDVDALGGMSISSLFYAMLGNKEQRLVKERQELVAAKLKYDQASHTVEHLSVDLQQLQEALSPLEDVDARLEKLLGKKEIQIAKGASDTARRLSEFVGQIGDLKADAKELAEAVAAGNSALRSVEAIQRTLDSAANWGTLDLLGGGMLTTMAKHSKMDAAKREARSAQQKLLRFQEELADADQRLQVSLQIDGFAKFADYFFDGLIADWVMQSKIRKAKTECSGTISQVKAAIRQCRRRLYKVESEIAKLTESKRELIEKA